MSVMESILSKYVILDENIPNSLIFAGKNDVVSHTSGKVVKFFFLPKFGEKKINMVEFD